MWEINYNGGEVETSRALHSRNQRSVSSWGSVRRRGVLRDSADISVPNTQLGHRGVIAAG